MTLHVVSLAGVVTTVLLPVKKHRNDTNTHSSKQPHPLTFHNTSIHSIATPLHSNIYSYFTTFHRYLSTFTVTGTPTLYIPELHLYSTICYNTATPTLYIPELHLYDTFYTVRATSIHSICSYLSTFYTVLSELHQYIPK